jgi:hypothetical protein
LIGGSVVTLGVRPLLLRGPSAQLTDLSFQLLELDPQSAQLGYAEPNAGAQQ